MAVLKTTSPPPSVSFVVRAPNARPRTTVPSSRASRAGSDAMFAPVHHLAANDGVRDAPAQLPTAERRVAQLRAELLDVDLVGRGDVDHRDVGGRALFECAAGQPEHLRRTDGEAANESGQRQHLLVDELEPET